MIRNKDMTAHQLLDADIEEMSAAQDVVEHAMELWAEVNQFRPIGLGDVDKEFWKIGEELGAVARRICQFYEVYGKCVDMFIETGNAKESFSKFKYYLHRFPEDNRWEEYVMSKRTELMMRKENNND